MEEIFLCYSDGKVNIFEVHCNVIDRRACGFIWRTVNRGIEEIKESLGYRFYSSHMFGFCCTYPPHLPPSPHPAVNESHEGNTVNELKCVLSESTRVVTPEELVWYDEVSWLFLYYLVDIPSSCRLLFKDHFGWKTFKFSYSIK